ncbi:MAG: hypothetical protein HY529_00430 [Chloroflexi bacterium]|nr:hypothetical protein [Chloroflexota bacterium]
MSIWAHRVNRVEYAEEPSFSVLRDEALLDMLDEFDEDGSLTENILSGAGMVDVPVKALKKALKSAAKLGLGEQTIRCLKQDIAFAESKKQDTVLYDCF